MTETFMGCLRDDPQILSDRLADFVRPKASAKELARVLESDVRTAENIRRGHWPQAKHWRRLVRAFGKDVLDAVFSPELDEVEARLEQEERDARQKYIAARAARQACCRAHPGSTDPLLPFGDD